MKKQNLIIIAVIIILLIAGGVYFTMQNKKSPTAYQQQTAMQPTEQKKNIFNSISDALSKGISLSCDFTDDQGLHVTSYVKNGAVRADMTGKSAQSSGSVLVKDNKIYFWNASMAIMMDKPQISVTPVQGQTGVSQEQNMMNNMEKYKQYCHEAVVSDSLFVPPSDVKFTDVSKMMQTPSGMPAVPSDYQKYMQQYQNKMPQGQ